MRAQLASRYEEWKALPRCEERGITWDIAYGSAGIGYAYGVGGLGLSGVGEGGGGMAHAVRVPRIRSAASVSSTNNQVAGVDEGDIVKTDGAYVYVAANGALRILDGLRPRLVSVTKLAGDVKELLLEGDRAVAFVKVGGNGRARCTYGYDCTFGGDGSRTKLVVLDLADRAHPTVRREIELSGALLATRRIGTTVHLVVADGEPNTAAPSYESWPAIIPSECVVKGMDAAAVRARFEMLARENEKTIRAAARGGGFPAIIERGVTRALCDAMHAQAPNGDAFTTLVSFDMTDDAAAPATAVVRSRPGVVFASKDALYFAVRDGRVDGSGETSVVHKFRIGTKASDTRYVGSGTVPGHTLNQFAMDEWYGYVRLATTRGRVPNPNVESAVTVLGQDEEGNLVRVGAVDHIAPGEDIRAVRFDEDRGYVVTFKKTDPLFVIDLAKPDAPAILGELKIPGFSTYMHRIDPTHLLSIGFDANDHGSFAFFDGVILQLFDVSKPTEPKLLHKEKIGTRGSSSEAATNHLAFNYMDDRKLLAIPMTVCEGGGDGRNGDKLAFSGLLLYGVDIEHGFKKLGGVSHGKAGVSCDTWWSSANSAVKRSVILDDLVFSLATDRAKVQRLASLGVDVADISFGL
jgi:hypothetical protein